MARPLRIAARRSLPTSMKPIAQPASCVPKPPIDKPIIDTAGKPDPQWELASHNDIVVPSP